MIVRCGRCQIELEVAGPGEFTCPSCGTRNAVRGAAPAATSPFGVPDLGGFQPQTPASDQTDPAISWVQCPSCRYRFAVGEVDAVSCPTCAASLSVNEDGSVVVAE